MQEKLMEKVLSFLKSRPLEVFTPDKLITEYIVHTKETLAAEDIEFIQRRLFALAVASEVIEVLTDKPVVVFRYNPVKASGFVPIAHKRYSSSLTKVLVTDPKPFANSHVSLPWDATCEAFVIENSFKLASVEAMFPVSRVLYYSYPGNYIKVHRENCPYIKDTYVYLVTPEEFYGIIHAIKLFEKRLAQQIWFLLRGTVPEELDTLQQIILDKLTYRKAWESKPITITSCGYCLKEVAETDTNLLQQDLIEIH